MRFSLFTVLDYYEDGTRTLSTLYAQLLDQMVEAEHLGFDAYWIGEHHGYLTPHHALACPNPALVLTAAAQRTRRIGLNTAIANLSLRHPLLLAEDYALVDLLSQGRLGLGIRRGSYPHEYAAFGLSREESRARYQVHLLEERNQLWFGTPGDLIQWIEQHQAVLDNRHFVFWLDFGGMPSATVHRSLHLLAREVIPHFTGQVD